MGGSWRFIPQPMRAPPVDRLRTPAQPQATEASLSAPARLDPAIVDFVKALARASVARDIAAARARASQPQDSPHANSHLRPLQLRAAKRPVD